MRHRLRRTSCRHTDQWLSLCVSIRSGGDDGRGQSAAAVLDQLNQLAYGLRAIELYAEGARRTVHQTRLPD